MTGFLDQWKRALFAVLAVPTLAACGGIADEFLPNTERGRLEVNVARAVNTNPDNVTEFMGNERLRFARGMLAHTLPPGVEVHVDVHASDFGRYHFGGGWITRGDLYVGRHTVPTETIEVVSSDVHVLTAEIVPNPTDPSPSFSTGARHLRQVVDSYGADPVGLHYSADTARAC